MPTDPILEHYQGLGGLQSPLGAPIEASITTVGGGQARRYQRGWIYSSDGETAYEVHDAIAQAYERLGGPSSVLGYPVTDVCHCHDQVGRISRFDGGVIVWHPSYGAFEVHGDILGKWLSLGAERGELGYPQSNEESLGNGVMRNLFQRGAIYWSFGTGAHALQGAIWQRWVADGELSRFGLPIQEEAATADGTGRISVCQKGWLRLQANGAVAVSP